MVAQIRYSVAERSRGRVVPCAVCTVHVETRCAGFLVELQNQGRRFVSGLASKSLGRFLQFGLKTGGNGFLVESQYQGSGGFPDLGLKIGIYGLVIWASKSPRRFLGLGLKTIHASVCRLRHKTNGGRSVQDTHPDRVEASRARVSQSGLKTGGGATTGGAHGTVTDVVSGQVEDGRVDAMGYVEPCYPCFTVFFLLCPRAIIVF
jgi:hypothetical protein